MVLPALNLLTAMATSFLVAACATVGPWASSLAIVKATASSCSSGATRLISPEGRGIVAMAEHRHFLGAGGAHALDLALNAPEQRVDPQSDPRQIQALQKQPRQ